MSQNSFCLAQHCNFYHYTNIFNLRVSSSSKILPIIVLTSTIALFIAGINPIIYVIVILGITLPPYFRVSSSSKILSIVVLTSTIALSIAGISINPIIYVTAILGITLPPYSAFQEKKITDRRAMRQTNESMTREMENLQYNNDRLKAENEKLEGSGER